MRFYNTSKTEQVFRVDTYDLQNWVVVSLTCGNGDRVFIQNAPEQEGFYVDIVVCAGLKVIPSSRVVDWLEIDSTNISSIGAGRQSSDIAVNLTLDQGPSYLDEGIVSFYQLQS
ncbi:unnamed protein product [Protopolystoma xenopodis]|uniref:Uncharacterized protein n=1 Tax=Protopolystoma xenopodis TaxID=117903 RepID=A0A3S5CVB4_9PLAT|nr:unnamed protein product [Protopolystoma xenopodis]